MTYEQEEYMRRLSVEMERLDVRFTSPPPIIDASVFYDMGYDPEQAARALMGHDIKTLTRVIEHMRETGILLPQ